MDTDSTHALALDIGGTKLAVAILDVDGDVHGYREVPTRVEEGHDAILRRLFDIGHETIASSGALGESVGTVGISCGGPLDAPSGLLLGPPHLPGWIDVPIGPMAEDAFGVPAVLVNDATAGAWGEYRRGAGQDVDSLVYLTISTGMGGGAVLDGRLHRGAAGNGGEFGHMIVRPGGRRCSCGRRGCVEAYVSGTAIAERAAEALQAGRASYLATLSHFTAEDVAAAAAAGDVLSREIWDETTELLGMAVTDLANVFEPDLIVLGGGVTRSGSMLVDPVKDTVATSAMGPASRGTTIAVAALGHTACVVGAGQLALDRIRSHHDAAPQTT